MSTTNRPGTSRDAADRMSKGAHAFLSSLDPEQLTAATTSFDVPDHRDWSYLPGHRPGLSMVDMTTEQQALALELLDAGCSAPGARTARGVIEVERIRRALATGGSDLDGDRYWVRVLGDPAGRAPWAWRVNGHHLAVHLTVVADAIAVTPSFFGAEPATVPHGPHEGLRTLPEEEDLARALLAELDPPQRAVAIFSKTAPNDIRTRHDPVADPAALPSGLPYSGMSDAQRDLLGRLVRRYFDRAPLEHAQACWRGTVDAGLDAVTFSWAGPDEHGHGHYYCVRGPTFLIEYDNTQDGANHIHSVWRDLRNDWGADLLATHYADYHSGQPADQHTGDQHAGDQHAGDQRKA